MTASPYSAAERGHPIPILATAVIAQSLDFTASKLLSAPRQ